MTTLLSGPVARWSTKTGHRLAVINTPVYPAMKEFDIIAYANNYWTDIEHSMNDAESPYDRLLDFLPDTKAQWKYVADQWTRTWSMHCESVPRTPIDLVSTGECKGYTVPEGASVRYETLPQLYSVLNISNFELSGDDWAGFSVSNKPQAKDMLLFIYGHNIVDQDSSTNRVYGMDVSIASVHLHNLNKNLTTPNNCSTAAGPIGSATYTRIDCTLSRERKIADEHLVPYPEAVDTEMLIARALSQNFQARFMMESATNRTITEIKPEELIRFYQVYMISKDTQYRQSTLRPLIGSQQVPQLSSAFLAVALPVTVLCVVSSSAWCIFKLTHHGVNDVPQTKTRLAAACNRPQ
ncbi:hypothetical protein LTR70_007303 [Exophiala xenobiotica]|uniref:Uncharacterized protein n=1 Tax=Lithohypha guttulata TaxID=1690604 RepID=A0ABR0K2E0_9EURO|nr:hypothetical protein LTR24_007630 [Lithohypha guttulata]KAK5314162.1 hypothetical protein LTR70_007303 [Exophiala xenobiotica]